MSITIVSTQPKPTQAAAAVDSTANSASGNNDAAVAVQDFASLLLGQLIPLSTNGTPSASKKAELPESKESPAVEGTSLPADTTNLFAALGVVPTEVKPVSETVPSSDSALPALASSDSVLPTLGKTDDTGSDKLKALQSLAAQTGEKVSPDSAAANQHAEATALVSDKPAKFAVPTSTIPQTDAIVSNKTAETLATANASTSPTNVNATVQNILPVHHDAQVSVPTPVRDQSWTNDFSQKVVWLATNDKQSAQITLNPPQMGPIEVSITMDKGSATASFASANQEVRDSIETALPRLREMFASAGIELGQTNVSAESFKQQANNEQWKSTTPRWANDNAILVTNASGTLPARAFHSQQGNGFVDIFA